LRAYYFAKEEKLLVYDYEPIGSLHLCLHGHGPCRTALNWATRLKIILEAARALRYLHHECGKPKLAHGNIKAANILLDENYNALLADFGLAMIIYPGTATTSARVAGYRAPEQADLKHISQAADVYSFGVLMLELLTGKSPAAFHSSEKGIDLPKWVHSVVREEWTGEVFDIELMREKHVEEDMVSLLQTALLCTEPIAERRPKMTDVVPLIEKLSSLDPTSDSPNDSVCQSPSRLSRDLTTVTGAAS
jgi:serine/threonine protein kinase